MTKEGYEELRDLQMKYVEDVTITKQNLPDQVMRVPAIKAFWTETLYAYRHTLSMEEDKLKIAYDNDVNIKDCKLKVTLPKSEIKKLELKNNVKIDIIQARVNDLKEIIANLKDYQKISAFYGNDVKNVIDYMKLDESV